MATASSRRDGEVGSEGAGVGRRRGRLRLQRRRLYRSIGHQYVRRQPTLPQQWRRQFHRRHQENPRPHFVRRASAPRRSISTTTAGSICFIVDMHSDMWLPPWTDPRIGPADNLKKKYSRYSGPYANRTIPVSPRRKNKFSKRSIFAMKTSCSATLRSSVGGGQIRGDVGQGEPGDVVAVGHRRRRLQQRRL